MIRSRHHDLILTHTDHPDSLSHANPTTLSLSHVHDPISLDLFLSSLPRAQKAVLVAKPPQQLPLRPSPDLASLHLASSAAIAHSRFPPRSPIVGSRSDRISLACSSSPLAGPCHERASQASSFMLVTGPCHGRDSPATSSTPLAGDAPCRTHPLCPEFQICGSWQLRRPPKQQLLSRARPCLRAARVRAQPAGAFPWLRRQLLLRPCPPLFPATPAMAGGIRYYTGHIAQRTRDTALKGRGTHCWPDTRYAACGMWDMRLEKKCYF